MQNTLIKIPKNFGTDWPWPSRSNLTFNVKMYGTPGWWLLLIGPFSFWHFEGTPKGTLKCFPVIHVFTFPWKNCCCHWRYNLRFVSGAEQPFLLCLLILTCLIYWNIINVCWVILLRILNGSADNIFVMTRWKRMHCGLVHVLAFGHSDSTWLR